MHASVFAKRWPETDSKKAEGLPFVSRRESAQREPKYLFALLIQLWKVERNKNVLRIVWNDQMHCRGTWVNVWFELLPNMEEVMVVNDHGAPFEIYLIICVIENIFVSK